VNSAADTDQRDSVLTLREALRVATGDLAYASLSPAEQARVSSSSVGAAAADTIVFDPSVFPPANPGTIRVESELPALSSGGDTLDATGAGVILSGENTSGAVRGIVLSSAGNLVRGLTIVSFRGTNGAAVAIIGPSATGNRVEGSLIGTDAAGNQGLGNYEGVVIAGGATNNVVGGSAAGAGNTIVKSMQSGVRISGAGTSGNRVEGNLIGTNAASATGLGQVNGVLISEGATSNLVGGTGASAGNTIVASTGSGVRIIHEGTSGNRVEGNYLGTTAAGATNLGNHQGVAVTSGATGATIGGSAPGAGNVIAYNTGNGVAVGGTSGAATTTRQVTISRNRIFSNSAGGIDLGDDGPTSNDPGDTDSGPNDLLNYPVSTSASTSQASGTAPPGSIVEIFVADPSGAVQGRTFVGGATADSTTGAFTVPLRGVAVGQYLTATATDAEGNTSEFAPRVPVS